MEAAPVRATVRKPAPSFKGQAYWNKKFQEISLEQFKGKYVVLFFYPLDFTFVCPTEIVQFSDKAKEFEAMNCQVIAASIDSHFTHKEWTKKDRKKGGLGEMAIPMLADISHQISRDYGCLIEDGPDAGVAFRATYIIDGNGILRHMSINDLPVGRNAEEVIRLVSAFQYTDEYGEVCPASWKKGDATMVPETDNAKTADYFEKANQ
jgi:alkyl hydroperoxide reductase subunit AhpC|tara:strand:- start:128 stop:748 length:621 start_codon:yes stop_codon:yes gene_type:complete